MQTKKKQSNIGCFVFVAIILVGFFYLPWMLVIGFAIAASIAMVLVFSILNEVKKIRKRSLTRKSLISKANEGYTELVAKIKPENLELQSWIDRTPADFTWLSFQKFHGSRHAEPRGKWKSFFDIESENNFFKVTDGSGDCWVTTHMSDFQVERSIQYFSQNELRHKLKDVPINDFPLENLGDNTEIRAVEKWIRKDQTLFFFGHLHDLSHGHKDLKTAAAKAWGAIDYRNRSRLMGNNEWSDLLQKSEDSSPSIRKILTANYEAEPVERLIISKSGDSTINIRSYLAIIAFLIGLGFLLYPVYSILSSEYSEILDRINDLLNP